MPTIAGWIAKGKGKVLRGHDVWAPPARLPASIRWDDEGPMLTADLNATEAYGHEFSGQNLYRFSDGSALVCEGGEGEEVVGRVPGPWVEL